MTTTQVDLFLDTLVDAPVKDDRALMEFPFFSLQKQPRHEPMVYDDGQVNITIEPGNRGIATIWDKDVLIYVASIINDRIERGAPVDPTIQFPVYDFLKVTGRGTGKQAYELFLDALHRLRSTSITTTIASGGDTERRGFGWLADWRVIERTNSKGDKVMAGVQVSLNRWLFNGIVKDRRVLTISRDYFKLTKGLERRLYELARKHVGNQPEWFIGLARLAEKCGTTDPSLRKFKMRLTEIIKDGTIPDYRMELVAPDDQRNVPFRTRDGLPMIRFTPIAERIDATTTLAVIDHVPDLAEIPAAKSGDQAPRISIKGYDEARRLFPDYDVNYLEQRWQEWTLAKGGSLKNPDKAFLAWCTTYTSNNPL